MTTNYHVPIAIPQQITVSSVNTPLGTLDAQITMNTTEIVASRGVYTDLETRIDAISLAGSNVAMVLDGAANAAQKIVTVINSTGALAHAPVAYALVGGALEYNIIDTVDSGMQITLTTNIGTGGIADGSIITLISLTEYEAAQAIPHAGTLTLDKVLDYSVGDVHNVLAYGALGDDIGDDTIAINAAIAACAAGDTLWFPPGLTYKVTARINLNKALTVLARGATIDMAFASNDANGQLFFVTASDVHIIGGTVDGSNLSPDAQTVSYYGVMIHATAGNEISKISIMGMKFHDMEAQGAWGAGGTIPNTSYASHAIYCHYANDVMIAFNEFDTIAGAAILIHHCSRMRIIHNDINDTLWYSIDLDRSVDGIYIADNTIAGTRSMCRYWGGSINLAGNNGAGETIRNITIAHNHIRGTHSYGNAIVINSSIGVLCIGNDTKDIVSGTAVLALAHITVQSEYIGGTDNLSCIGVVIADNVLSAGGVQQRGIWAANSDDNITPLETIAKGLIIRGNQFISPDSNHYFITGIVVLGYKSGYQNVVITDNYIEILPQNISLTGAIVLYGVSTTGWVYDVVIKNNIARSIIAAPAENYEYGLHINAYSDRIYLGGNVWKNFTYGARKFSNSGNVVLGIEDDSFPDCTYTTSGFTIPTFAAGDTTPSIVGGRVFKTANTAESPALISMLDGGVVGQTVKIIIADAYTDIDFTGTLLRGHGGVNWTDCTTGDHMICTYDGTYWYCDVSDNTA
jgi:hypothetical protein